MSEATNTTQEDESRNRLMMSIVDDILRLDEDAIQLMRETPVLNLRAISRGAQSIKSPNPLDSMMATVSLKYPISINVKSAKQYNVPNEYMHSSEDQRRHGRRLCTLKLINWFIESTMPTSEEVKDAVRRIMLVHAERARFVNSVDWSNVPFVVGSMNYERTVVATNPREIDIPRAHRDDAIAQILTEGLMMNYNEVPRIYIDQIQELMNARMLRYVGVEDTIRFIRSALDSKMRYLPTISGLNPNFIHIRHLAIQPNLHIADYSEFSSSSLRHLHDLSVICGLIIQEYNNETTVREYLNEFAFQGTLLRSLLLGERKETLSIKAVKSLMNIKCTSVFEFEGFDVIMKTGCGRAQKLQNLVGVYYNVYPNNETIWFKRDPIRGCLKKEGLLLLSITINFEAIMYIEDVMGLAAAIVCRDFHKSKKRSEHTMRREAYQLFRERPWEVISFTQGRYINESRVLKQRFENRTIEGTSWSIVRIVEHFDVKDPELVTLTYSPYTGELRDEEDRYCGVVKAERKKCMPEGVNTQCSALIKVLDPKDMIKMLPQIYSRKVTEFAKAFRHGWPIDLVPTPILEYVNSSIKHRVACIAHKLCEDASKDSTLMHLIPVYMLFLMNIREIPPQCVAEFYESGKVIFKYARKHVIDFSFNTGDIRVDKNSTKVVFDGVALVNPERSFDMSTLFCSPIEGYRLSLKYTPNLGMKPTFWLIANKDDIRDGTTYTHVYEGTMLYFTRDSTYSTEAMKTLVFHTSALQDFEENPPATPASVQLDEFTRKRKQAIDLAEFDAKRARRDNYGMGAYISNSSGS